MDRLTSGEGAQKNDEKVAENPNEGHRQRLYQRFDNTGLDGFADHEILEMLLFYVYRQRDTKGLAKSLLKEFGSLEKVFSAGSEQVCKIPGIGPASARIIAMMREVSILLSRRRALSADACISNGSDLIRYLGTAMENLPGRAAAGNFCEQCQPHHQG